MTKSLRKNVQLDNPAEESSSYFSTHDLACAGSLIVCGFELVSLNRSDPRKIKFIFRSEDKIRETVKKFWDGNLKVDAQGYFNAIKRLKNQIYSE